MKWNKKKCGFKNDDEKRAGNNQNVCFNYEKFEVFFWDLVLTWKLELMILNEDKW